MKKAKPKKLGALPITKDGLMVAHLNLYSGPVLTRDKKALLNSLLVRQKVGYMLLESAGKLYLLVEHWRYLNPTLEAKRAPLFKGTLPRNPTYVYSLLV